MGDFAAECWQSKRTLIPESFQSDTQTALLLLTPIGPTTVTTVDRIRFMSSGRTPEGIEMVIRDPDEEGVGEVGPVGLQQIVLTWQFVFQLAVIPCKNRLLTT